MRFENKPRRHFHNVFMNPAFHNQHYRETSNAKIEYKIENFIFLIFKKIFNIFKKL